ncbi:MAG: rare lipoprotein [Desulfovibrionales bacterium]|nr:rare lipoprotein [Desulfovibrionales bacterium]
MLKKILVLISIFLFMSCAKQKINTTATALSGNRSAYETERAFTAPDSSTLETVKHKTLSTFTQSGMVRVISNDAFNASAGDSSLYEMKFFPCAHVSLDVGTHLVLTDLRTDKTIQLVVVTNQKTNPEYILEMPEEAGKPFHVAEGQSLFGQIKIIDDDRPATEELSVDYEKAVNETSLNHYGGAAGAAPKANTQPTPVYIQVGAFKDHSKAQNVFTELKNKGFTDSRIVTIKIGENTLYRVQAGIFENENTAATKLRALEKDYPGSFILKD